MQRLKIKDKEDIKIPAYHINSVRYVREDAGLVRKRERSSTDILNSECYFGSIPGAIFGNPLKHVFSTYHIKDSKIDLKVTLDTFNDKLIIAPFDPKKAGNNRELTIQPPGVKMARIATLCKAYPTGFALDSLNMVVLVYFDAPVTISGTVWYETNQMYIDLNIPRKGFYFLQRTWLSVGKATQKVLIEPATIHYVIFPKEF